MYNEFNQLFASLFDDSEKHLSIIKELAKVRKAISRKELLSKTKLTSGGDFSIKIEELIESGFITEYSFYQNKKKQFLYRLTDEYSLFYLKFIEKNKKYGKGTWQNLANTQSYISWSGFSFETLCLKHINQIKKALNIEVVYSTNNSWFNENAQIDLLIDRNDNVINICELKFSQSSFAITKNYHQKLKNKLDEFKLTTKTKKNVYLTMITTYGVSENKYSLEIMTNELTMNCLFIKI